MHNIQSFCMLAAGLCFKKNFDGFTVGNTFSMCQQRHPAGEKGKYHTRIYK